MFAVAGGLWRGVARLNVMLARGPDVALRSLATGAGGNKKGKKKDGKEVESKTMAKLRKKLEKKNVETSAAASLIDSVLNPKESESKGVPMMSEFMPRLVEGGPRKNKLNMLRYLERRQLVETVKKKEFPHFRVGSIVRVEYKDYMTQKGTSKFTGLVIASVGDGLGKNFTVRTALENEGFEIQFPLCDPLITKITTLKYQRAKKAKLFYMRDKGLKAVTFSQKMKAIPPKDGQLGLFEPPRKN